MTTDENPQPPIEGDENPETATDPPNPQPEVEGSGETPEEDPETFPREYVQRLRDESARYRQRAGRADEAEQRLLETTVRSAAADLLADPGDLLTFTEAESLVDGDGWPDPDAIVNAAKVLVQSKPHLAPRRPRGDIGQGAIPSTEEFNLAAAMRERAL